MTWNKFLLPSAILHLFLFDDNHVLARDSFPEGQTRGKKHVSKIIGGEEPDPDSPSANHVTSQTPIVCENGTEFKLEIKFDLYPEDMSWDVVDECDDNKEVASGKGSDNDYVALRVYNKCLTTATKYRFTLYDSFGDGFCDDTTCICTPLPCDGYYVVTFGDNEEVSVAGNFGYRSSLEFGMTDCPTTEIPSIPPSLIPSSIPSSSPSSVPSRSPSDIPSSSPSEVPSDSPSTCSSVGNHFYLRKTFCKGRANSSNSKFARHWKVKNGEKEDVLNTVCKFKKCKKSDCCEKGGPRKCTNTGNKGPVQGGFTKEMCGSFKKLKSKKELKDSPCTGQDGFKCTKKDCCNAI